MITIREVGPRDGLQGEDPLPVDARVRLVDALVAAGLRVVEAVSFVSPKAVPAMAGAEDVAAAVLGHDGVTIVGLVPNLRGAERAVAAGVDALTFTVSCSPAYNERNVGMTIEASLEQLAGVCTVAGERTVDCVISFAFGSPYEGDTAPEEVVSLADRARAAGAASITLADTTGTATPRRVDDVLAATGTDIGLHLHDTRGTALVNAYAAMKAGVHKFDTSVGGLGGSPFAPEAGGNLATEDLVHLCDDLGVATGIDIEALLEASALVAELVGHPVPSRVARAGPRTRRS